MEEHAEGGQGGAMVRLGRATLLQVLLMLPATADPAQEFTRTEEVLGGESLKVYRSRTRTSRRSVALDGYWEFSLDPQRTGVAKGWHTAQYPLPHSCPVPAAWEAAGFGDATERIWHSYTPTNATMDGLYHIGAGRNSSMGGLAWYRKNISLPAAEAEDGQLLFLRVGGVHRQVTAYANGVYLGHHVGYLHELEWDVTAAVAAAAAGGRSSLAVVLAVDSFHDMTIDPLIGAFDMGEIPSLNARLSSGGAALEGLSGPWGGIWGHVALEWRRRTWLAEMFAQATNATVVATAALHGAPTEGSGDEVQLEVFDCSTGQMVATSTAKLAHALDPTTQRLSVRAVIPEADLKQWSPSAPALYNATLTLLSSSALGSLPAATDSLTVRFGVKDLRIVGHQFVLNGRKIFLSGFGMDSSFADTIAAPSDKAYYLRRWQLAKSFGFNFVRCHSGFYPPELYAAADEVGMFVSPELPIIGDTYYNAALRLNSTFAYHGAWRAVITRFRNHPSIFDWSMGNEHRAAFINSDLPKELYATAKELDPLRFVIASDGGVPYPSADFHGNPTWMRPYHKNETEDFYSKGLPDATRGPSLANAPKPDKPLIGHEEGNFNTFPHLLKAIGDLTPPGKASKFLKPFWLTGARDHLQAAGLLGETELWAQRSGQLLVLNFKQLIEYFRFSPWVSGHEWWLFAQFWLAGNGLVDYAYDVKPGITPSIVSSYLGDVVLLAGNGSGIAPAYVAGSELSVPLSISNFGAAAVDAQHVQWSVQVNGTIVCSGAGAVGLKAEQGAITTIGVANCSLPAAGSFPAKVGAPKLVPQTLQLSMWLVASSTTPRTIENNSWHARVYPSFRDDAPAPAPFFVHTSQPPDGRAGVVFNDPKSLPAGADGVTAKAVVLVDALTPDVHAALSHGATVVLVVADPAKSNFLPTVANKFASCDWLCAPTDNNVGTVIYPSARRILEGMDEQGWCDGSWQRMIDGSSAFLMDPPTVSNTSTPTHDEVRRNATIHIRALDYVLGGPRSKALLVELGAKGQSGGRLIATSLNLWQNFNASIGFEHPEKAYLLWKLLDHGFS